jgi:2-C-methyl-D-erythritol 4-phosphate cytidylyltransferase
MKVVAIVPSAGLGKRFGPGLNKPFQNLGGKSLIIRTLETLHSVPEVQEIIPVLKGQDMEYAQKMFEQRRLTKIKRIAPGGKERQDSVFKGLKLVENKDCLILIHDGVRPLIEKEVIERALQEMLVSASEGKGIDGIVLGVPVKDTIKEAESGLVKKTLKREALWAIQTPQIFPYKKIVQAYEKAMREGFYTTDDSALIEKYGGKVKVVMGSYRNIKITTPEDLEIAEVLLKE